MSKYYVYFHRLLDGTIFYVGKGTRDRLKSKSGRGKRWQNIVRNNEWYYEVHREGLSEKEALDLEIDLIAALKPEGNTRFSANRYKPLDSEFILENYEYDVKSPTGLSYRPRNGKIKVGKYGGAGFLSGKYYKIKGALGGGNVAVHRVVWFLVKGYDPLEKVIDHLDGNPLNNNIENLRAVSIKENNRNLNLRESNTTGFQGVVEKENYYLSSWRESGGKSKVKVFSKRKHGEKLALGLAAYKRVVELKGLDYTDRHLSSDKIQYLLETCCWNIEDMLNDSTRDDNTSGFTGVTLLKIEGYSYWVYKQGAEIKSRFSTLKYGDRLAKALAIESRNKHLNLGVNPIDGYSQSDVESMLVDSNHCNSTNKEHIYRNGNTLQLLIKNKHGFLSKKRSISKHGYDKAITDLIKIRDDFLFASK